MNVGTGFGRLAEGLAIIVLGTEAKQQVRISTEYTRQLLVGSRLDFLRMSPIVPSQVSELAMLIDAMS